jgi:large subunit ribosomal protein L31
MKKNIHPKYFDKATITCACGNVIKTGSTKEKMEIEVCSACHPFYTGKKKVLDTTGRVDRFKKRMEKSEKIQSEKKAKKTKKGGSKNPSKK